MAAMIQIAIRCHPRAPLPAEDFGVWLEREIADLRAEDPQRALRLSSLTQHLPGGDVEIGWLVELEVPDDDPRIPGLRTHLEGCPACQEEHQSLRALVSAEG